MRQQMQSALTATLGFVIALVIAWLTLIIVLLLARPKGGLQRRINAPRIPA